TGVCLSRLCKQHGLKDARQLVPNCLVSQQSLKRVNAVKQLMLEDVSSPCPCWTTSTSRCENIESRPNERKTCKPSEPERERRKRRRQITPPTLKRALTTARKTT
ncbi:unnamed protein product, partial [Aphanomyces euteiches]